MHLSVALRQHAQLPVQLGSQHVGIRVARRQEDGMVSISQGSAPVLQVHMCHCPVEPVGDDKAVRLDGHGKVLLGLRVSVLLQAQVAL